MKKITTELNVGNIYFDGFTKEIIRTDFLYRRKKGEYIYVANSSK